MYKGNDLEDEEMNDDEMSEEEDTEIDEEFYEAIKILVIAVQAVIHIVNELRVIEASRQIEHPLNPQRINNTFGYKYILGHCMMTLQYSEEYIGCTLMCYANCATSLEKKHT